MTKAGCAEQGRSLLEARTVRIARVLAKPVAGEWIFEIASLIARRIH